MCGVCPKCSSCPGLAVMPWAKVDDNFHDHPKIVRLLDEPDGLTAVGLWTICLAWARKHHKRGQTEALIAHGVPRRLTGCDPTLPSLLVKVGLWTECADGWMIHDYKDYLPSEAMSNARAEAGRKGGLKSGQSRVSAGAASKMLQERSVGFEANEATVKQASGLGIGSSKELEVVESSVGRASPKRGTRLPSDFQVTPEMVRWARAKVPSVNGKVETEKFINYWSSKAGKDATKLDWVATWRNWMITAGERAAPPGKQAALDADGFWER